MAEHLAQETIDGYRAGTLPADGLLAADDHLAACHECRARALDHVSVSKVATLFETIRREESTSHCTYEILEAYVDGRLPAGEGQHVQSHVERCTTCAEDLGDLRQAKALLNTGVASSSRREGISGALAALWQHGWMRMTGGAVAAALTVWLVFTVGGRETRERDERARQTPAPAPGDVAPASPVVATLRDGRGEVVLRGDGELSGLPALSAVARDAVAAALATGRLSVVATSTLALGSGTLRGTDTERRFDVSGPIGRVVESDRPTFRWTPHPAARAYRVAVFDTSFTEVAASAEITASEWVPDSPLPRGKTLIWQVTALTPDGPVQAPVPPAAEARFAVLERAQADELDGVRRSDPESHLVLAVLYARAGMPEEARQQLAVLAERNPDSALARNLAASLPAPR